MNIIQKARLDLMVKNMFELRTQIAYIEEGLRLSNEGELQKLKVRLKMKEEQIKEYKKAIGVK